MVKNSRNYYKILAVCGLSALLALEVSREYPLKFKIQIAYEFLRRKRHTDCQYNRLSREKLCCLTDSTSQVPAT